MLQIQHRSTTVPIHPFLQVVSYSFHSDSRTGNDDKKLLKGVRANLDLVRDFYPDFVARVYLDAAAVEDKTLGKLCALACSDNKLDLCDVGRMPGEWPEEARSLFPMTWGFLATLDPQVFIYECQVADRVMLWDMV